VAAIINNYLIVNYNKIFAQLKNEMVFGSITLSVNFKARNYLKKGKDIFFINLMAHSLNLNPIISSDKKMALLKRNIRCNVIDYQLV